MRVWSVLSVFLSFYFIGSGILSLVVNDKVTAVVLFISGVLFIYVALRAFERRKIKCVYCKKYEVVPETICPYCKNKMEA